MTKARQRGQGPQEKAERLSRLQAVAGAGLLPPLPTAHRTSNCTDQHPARKPCTHGVRRIIPEPGSCHLRHLGLRGDNRVLQPQRRPFPNISMPAPEPSATLDGNCPPRSSSVPWGSREPADPSQGLSGSSHAMHPRSRLGDVVPVPSAVLRCEVPTA